MAATLVAAAQATPPPVLDAFGELLASDVNDGEVNYPAFADSEAFAETIAALATAKPPRGASDNDRLAFYINAYNALSIQGILDGYSPSTLWGRLKFFKRRKYRVLGTSISLFDLEHDYIIASGDTRIHFAIVCSSQSCPPLQSALYDGETLDTQLDDVARGFINDAESNQFDIERRKAKLSRIFDWYRDEFEAENGSLETYLAKYIDDPALKQSLLADTWDLDFLDYDWSLNGTPLK